MNDDLKKETPMKKRVWFMLNRTFLIGAVSFTVACIVLWVYTLVLHWMGTKTGIAHLRGCISKATAFGIEAALFSFIYASFKSKEIDYT